MTPCRAVALAVWATLCGCGTQGTPPDDADVVDGRYDDDADGEAADVVIDTNPGTIDSPSGDAEALRDDAGGGEDVAADDDAGPRPCTADRDCDDGDPCTLDTCSGGGVCTAAPVATSEIVSVAGPAILHAGMVENVVYDGSEILATVVQIAGGLLPSDLYLHRVPANLSGVEQIHLGNPRGGSPLHGLAVSYGGGREAVTWAADPDDRLLLAIVSDWPAVRTADFGWVVWDPQIVDTGSGYFIAHAGPVLGPHFALTDYDGVLLDGPTPLLPDGVRVAMQHRSVIWDGTHVIIGFSNRLVRTYTVTGRFADEFTVDAPCGQIQGLVWTGDTVQAAIACATAGNLSLYLVEFSPDGRFSLPTVTVLDDEPGSTGEIGVLVARISGATILSWADGTVDLDRSRYCYVVDGSTTATCGRFDGFAEPLFCAGPGSSVVLVLGGRTYPSRPAASLICLPDVGL